MNFAGLSGRLVHVPEFKFLNNHQPFCRIRLAVDKGLSGTHKRALEQQGQPTADFFTVLCFDAPARFLQSQVKAGRLPPGTPLDITGRLEQHLWTDRTTGAPRSVVVLRSREIRFAGRRFPKPDPKDAFPSVASPSPSSPNAQWPENARPEETGPESALTAPSAEGVSGAAEPLDSLPSPPS
jgi:single-stranded DNA-binding protein